MKRQKRLGVRSRLAIVVTGLWLLTATAWPALNKIHSDEETRHSIYTECASGVAPAAYAGTDCHIFLRVDPYSNDDPRMIWLGSAVNALAFAIGGWIALGVIFLIARWILAGRSGPTAAD